MVVLLLLLRLFLFSRCLSSSYCCGGSVRAMRECGRGGGEIHGSKLSWRRAAGTNGDGDSCTTSVDPYRSFGASGKFEGSKRSWAEEMEKAISRR